jgi:hypothetical protein
MEAKNKSAYKLESTEVSIDVTQLMKYIDRYTDHLKISKKEKLVTLNARGVRYEVMLNRMDSLPGSRFHKLKKCIELSQTDLNAARETFLTEKLADNHNEYFDEFYFNKDPTVVNVILDFYLGINGVKKTHLASKNICSSLLIEELHYWNIDDYRSYVLPCCLIQLDKRDQSFEEDLADEKAIIRKYILEKEEHFGEWCFPEFRKIVWNILARPKSSKFAMVSTIYFQKYTNGFLA